MTSRVVAVRINNQFVLLALHSFLPVSAAIENARNFVINAVSCCWTRHAVVLHLNTGARQYRTRWVCFELSVHHDSDGLLCQQSNLLWLPLTIFNQRKPDAVHSADDVV